MTTPIAQTAIEPSRPSAKVTRNSAKTCGERIAADMPCRSREITSTVGHGANPQSAEARVKAANPMRAGYETNRKGERVTGDDKLGLREAGTERASNARNGHVDDRGIHDRDKNACEHHDQRNLTPRVKQFTRRVLPDYSKSGARGSTCGAVESGRARTPRKLRRDVQVVMRGDLHCSPHVDNERS